MAGEDPIARAVEAYVDRGEFAGAATVVWRGGKVVQAAAVGWRDMEALDLLQRDAIFRIASMSKPVTSLAAAMLMEEGAFTLDEPITRWAPEFADMRVLRSSTGALGDTVPAERAITFCDLFTHRSGVTYGDFHPGPIDAAYYETLGPGIDSHLTPDEWMAGLASLPLIDQPGADFHYGHSIDVLGFLVARIEGRALGEVLQRRIFGPLGMVDTGFFVPAAKRDRRAQLYGFDEAGGLVPQPTGNPRAGAVIPDRPEGMAYEGGGAGLFSTLDDYLAFARVFIGDGAVDGVRLLKPETLALMRSNQLTEDQRARGQMLGLAFNGHGFGLGFAVVMDPATANPLRCQGGVGTVGWPGAYGGWWQADPTDGSVMIFLAQNVIDLPQITRGQGLGVYGAIMEFHDLATRSKLPA